MSCVTCGQCSAVLINNQCQQCCGIKQTPPPSSKRFITELCFDPETKESFWIEYEETDELEGPPTIYTPPEDK